MKRLALTNLLKIICSVQPKLISFIFTGKPVGNIKVQLTATNHNATAVNVKVLSALFFKDSTTNSSGKSPYF